MSGERSRRSSNCAALHRRASCRGFEGVRVQLEAETVREAGEVVEDADDVGDLQQRELVKAEVAQGLPVLPDHARGGGGELFCHRAEGAVARREVSQLAPALLLDCFYQGRVAVLSTQKLRVGLRSVGAILGGGGDSGDHLPLRVAQASVR